ncbi:hypothetical protein HYC85_024714 [Camellia sinensis]|uniref:Aldehyde dehydrogenase n=1 Tax=Camellia sinensis TaxID=4442 RepID=A0A7J7GCS7_CAMSI|nr:hypothetical protein HYC85_024714 [Camellia sinensis]
MEELNMSGGLDLERELEELRETYRSGKTKEASWRRSQLRALLNLLQEREDDIFLALKQDIGKHPVESYRDEAKLPVVAFPSTAELVPEPLGLVLVMSSWNFPFGLSLEPLIGAIAAGNVVVLKPSELAPACSSILAKTIHSYLDNKAVKVIQGSTRVGRIVMSAAAKHLTPVTMELGGKCPAVVDSLSGCWDKEVVIKRVLVGKFGTCAGQVCIGIDYILTEKTFTSTLVEQMKALIKKMFGDNPKESNSIARIINKHHFLRLKTLLDDPRVKASVVHGGSLDEDNLFIEPTILVDPPLETAIMGEEIFGPLLPIITLQKIEDSIEFIKSRPKPLTIYAFTKNEALGRRLVFETSSGSVTFNDAIIQYAADTLPFGGVGESGFGRYHGKFSFDAFTHEKAVFRRSLLTEFWFRFPPWNDYKMQLLKSSYHFDYLSIILIILGLKKTKKSALD